MGILFIDPAGAAQVDCPNGEDYSPCECTRSSPDSLPNIDCRRINLEQVAAVFNRTTAAELDRFSLFLSDSVQIIPADLLSNHRTRYIRIECPGIIEYSLRVDPQAFRSSKDTTQQIDISYCLMNRLDFEFMSGFNRVTETHFSGMSYVNLANWTSFPELPNLDQFSIFSSKGLNDWTTFPKLVKGLSYLSLSYNAIQNDAMDRILNWTVQYSADTLQELYIDQNDLTTIPWQLPVHSFLKLETLGLANQKTGIPFIPNGTFYHLVDRLSLYYLYSLNAGIQTIQEGAFQGKIS